MNNVHYMVKAVESSPALAVIGEDWIELHRDQACDIALHAFAFAFAVAIAVAFALSVVMSLLAFPSPLEGAACESEDCLLPLSCACIELPFIDSLSTVHTLSPFSLGSTLQDH